MADSNAQQSNKNTIPIRKPNRLKDYDYSQDGAYFITICAKNCCNIFGCLVGDAAYGVPPAAFGKIIVGDAAHGVPPAVFGKIDVGNAAHGVPPAAFDKIVVGDAAHGVPQIKLTETGEIVKQHIEHINMLSKHVRLDKYVIMPNHIHLIISIENLTLPNTTSVSRATVIGTPKAASPTLPQIINSLKSLTSKKLGKSIWQRSYYDRISETKKNTKKYGNIFI
jgi:REP element-mobilizing transposase RayT